MLFLKPKTSQGFTLIELLVVISIVSLLSSVVLSSLNGARAKARDARRMEDIHQIQLAIELYISQNGHAPYLGGACTANEIFVSDGSCTATDVPPDATNWSALASELLPFLKVLPRDPCGVSCPGAIPGGIGNANDFGWFSYRYESPGSGDFGNGGVATKPDSYAIFAQQLETQNKAFGYKNFGTSISGGL